MALSFETSRLVLVALPLTGILSNRVARSLEADSARAARILSVVAMFLAIGMTWFSVLFLPFAVASLVLAATPKRWSMTATNPLVLDGTVFLWAAIALVTVFRNAAESSIGD